jgi:tetratricopeptide (TPR) repeat protein
LGSCALVLVAAVLLYGRTLSYGFVWDDHQLVELNPLVNGNAPWQRIWTGSLFETSQPHDARFYRPLVVSSFRLNWLLSPSPVGFHLVNVVLHGVCGVLLLLLMRRLRVSLVMATLGTLLFVGWSGHTETVAWIAGRADLLLGIGALVMLLTLPPPRPSCTHTVPSAADSDDTPSVGSGSATRASPWRSPLATIGIFVGGLVTVLSKEPGLVVAAALSLVALLVPRDRPLRERLPLAIGAAMATAVGVALRILALGSASLTEAVGDQSLVGRLTRLGVQLQLLSGLDLRALVDLPAPGELHWWPLGIALAGTLGCLGASALAWRAGLHSVAALILLAWLALLPAATARVPALRYLYLPLALGCTAMAAAVDQRISPPRRKLLLAVAAALGLAWVGLGQVRLDAWRSDDRLFAIEAAQSPDNADAQFFYATRLLAHGRPRLAAKRLERTLERDPTHRPSWLVLGQAWLAAGELQRAEHVVRTSLRGEPRTSPQFVLLGRVMLAQRRPRAALEAFEQALQRTPAAPQALRGALVGAQQLGDHERAARYTRQLRAAGGDTLH